MVARGVASCTDGERHHEPRARGGVLVDDGAAVRVDEVAGEREAESDTVWLRRAERREEPLPDPGGNAGAPVAYRDRHDAVDRARLDLDDGSRRRGVDGVVEHVAERL